MTLDRYAILGQPVVHSLSPQIHRLFARQTGESVRYEKCAVPVDEFECAVSAFFTEGGRGVNITLPFKERAYVWVGSCDAFAEEAGAVNTIGVSQSGLWGANTDGIGLLADLINNHRASVARRRVLLIGAGGAARGVLGPLLRASPTSLTIANRSPAKARRLADAFGARYLETPVHALALTDLGQIDQPFDLVLNAASAGTKGERLLLPPGILRGAFCYDLAYRNSADEDQTAFCRQALDDGARAVSDGLGMLVEQAAAAFHLWRGTMPQTAPVLNHLREQLGDG